MAQATSPTCPRCGQRLKANRARFCSRCGLDLTSAGIAPAAATPVAPPFPPLHPNIPPRPPTRQVPPTPPRHYAPPMMMMAPPPHAMPIPARRPPKAKSSSGCGCLIVILIVVGIVIAIGASAEPRVWSPATNDVPTRPMSQNFWISGSDKPEISNAIAYCYGTPGSPENLQVSLKVRPGDEDRVLVAVYPLDNQGMISRWSSEALAARWVEMSFIPRKVRLKADVSMQVMLPPGPPPERVQISVFDGARRELRRQIVNVPK